MNLPAADKTSDDEITEQVTDQQIIRLWPTVMFTLQPVVISCGFEKGEMKVIAMYLWPLETLCFGAFSG